MKIDLKKREKIENYFIKYCKYRVATEKLKIH